MSDATIREIRRYPVKSLQGELVDHVRLSPAGIEGDRLYALRDAATGKVLSAKAPKIASLLLSCRARTDLSGVVVSVVGADFDVSDPGLLTAFGDLLGREVLLATTADSTDVYESYWPPVEDTVLSDMSIDLPIATTAGGATFADVAALQVLAVESVDHLRALNPSLVVNLERFRPSLALETGQSGFVEKAWVDRAAMLGSARVQFGAESPRCVMTTVAQVDLPRQPEVLQTIAQHNRVVYGGFGKFACLGIYADVVDDGVVAVGDPLTFAT